MSILSAFRADSMQKGHDKHSLKAVCHALTRWSSFSPSKLVDAGSFPACYTGLSQRVRRLNYVRNISVILLWSLLRTSGSISDISGLSDCCYVGWHHHGLLLPWLFHRLAGHITDRVCMPDILRSCFVSCPFRRSVRSIAFQSLPSKCYSCGRAGSCRYGMSRKR